MRDQMSVLSAFASELGENLDTLKQRAEFANLDWGDFIACLEALDTDCQPLPGAKIDASLLAAHRKMEHVASQQHLPLHERLVAVLALMRAHWVRGETQ
jgi:hypothetical protein